MLNWIATCSLKEVCFFPALIYLVREDFLPPRKYDSWLHFLPGIPRCHCYSSPRLPELNSLLKPQSQVLTALSWCSPPGCLNHLWPTEDLPTLCRACSQPSSSSPEGLLLRLGPRQDQVVDVHQSGGCTQKKIISRCFDFWRLTFGLSKSNFKAQYF